MSTPTVTFLTTPHIIFDGAMASCEVQINAGDVNGLEYNRCTLEAHDGVEWVNGLIYQIGAQTSHAIIAWPMAAEGVVTQLLLMLVNTRGEASEWIFSDEITYPPESATTGDMLVYACLMLGIGVAGMYVMSME